MNATYLPIEKLDLSKVDRICGLWDSSLRSGSQRQVQNEFVRIVSIMLRHANQSVTRAISAFIDTESWGLRLYDDEDALKYIEQILKQIRGRIHGSFNWSI